MSAARLTFRTRVYRLACAITNILLFSAPLASAQVTVNLTMPSNGSIYTAPASIPLGAIATASDGYTISKVEFFRSTTLIGSDTVAPYAVDWSGVAQGSYALTAKATAVKKNNPTVTATSSVVNVSVTAVTLTAPHAGSVYAPGSDIAISANATAPQGYTLSKVEFFHGSTLIGTDTVSPFGVVWPSVPQGNYAVTARSTAIKSGSADLTSTSAPVNVKVTLSPVITITTPAEGTVYATSPATFVVRVAANDPDGVIVGGVHLSWYDEQVMDTGDAHRAEPPYDFVVTIDPLEWDYTEYMPYYFSATALDNQGAWSGTNLTVTVGLAPNPPLGVNGLSPAAFSLTQGSSGMLNVSISPAQPTDTQVTLSSSQGIVASVPSSVTVPAGHAAASIPVTALAPGIAQITAELNGSTASSQITVTGLAATPISVVPALAVLAVGASTTLAVTISSAQSADTAVTLSASPAGIVDIPAQALVPAGQLSATAPLAALTYGQAGVTAALNGGSASAGINVVPPPATMMGLEPPQIAMTPGTTSTFTVRLNAVQATPTAVHLVSSDPGVLQVPATVSVPQGATAASFSATAVAAGDALITASVNDTSKASSVHVATPLAAVVAILPSPLPLQQGATGSLRVALNAAQSGPTMVTLFNFDPGVATLPASVTIPAGAISSEVTAQAFSPGTTQVTASLNGSSVSAEIQVATAAPVISSLSPATLTLPKGTPKLLRLSLSRAPSTAFPATLVSSNPAIASVPGQVNVPAGALYADFPVMANAQGSATITASLGGTAAQTVVSITAAELATLGISPESTEVYAGASVPFTATGTMTDGTAQDLTTLVTWSSSNSTVAVVSPTGVASAQNPGQTAVSASFSFNAVETGAPVTVTASTTLTVKPLAALTLSALTTSLTIGETVTVTLATSEPAPSGGLLVTLSGGGSGAGTLPPALTLAAQETSGTFSFTASGAGTFSIAASAPNRLPTLLTFTIAGVGVTPQVILQSPFAGAIIADDQVVVSGTWSGPSNTGITVNGVVAAISGNEFFATVPLVPGVNTITVVATVLGGNQTTATLSVSSSGPSPTRVTASAVQGFAPLVVSFTISSDRAIQSVDGTFTPGSPFSVSPVTGPLSFTYGSPGSYEAVFNIRHTDGTTVMRSVRIVVQSLQQVDQQVREVWTGFTSALTAGSRAQAMQFFAPGADQRFGPVLDVLAAELPAIVASFSPLLQASVTQTYAEYAVVRNVDGLKRLYLIQFVAGTDGLWRIESM